MLDQPRWMSPLCGEEGYAMVPLSVLRQIDLSIAARLVYALLCAHAREGNEISVPLLQLAGELGVSDRSVRTYLRELEEAELVDCQRTGNGLHRLLFALATQRDVQDDASETRGYRKPASDTTGSQLPIRLASYLGDNYKEMEGLPSVVLPPIVVNEQTALQKVQPATPRPRDLVFEAVAEVCGLDWRQLTKAMRGPLNRSVAELKSVDATPGEIHRRADAYRMRFPGITLSPNALSKWWPALGGSGGDQASATIGAEPPRVLPGGGVNPDWVGWKNGTRPQSKLGREES